MLGPAQALTFSLPMYFGFSFGLVQADVIWWGDSVQLPKRGDCVCLLPKYTLCTYLGLTIKAHTQRALRGPQEGQPPLVALVLVSCVEAPDLFTPQSGIQIPVAESGLRPVWCLGGGTSPHVPGARS